VSTLTIVLLLVSVAASAYFAYADNRPSHKPSPSYKSFTFTGSGTARNAKYPYQKLDVSLSFQGSAKGQLKIIISLNVKGGDLDVGNYAEVMVSNGFGSIVPCAKYVFFHLTMTGKYGGKHTCWFLSGKINGKIDNSMPVKLRADRLVLPLPGYPVIKDLKLDGVITLKY